MIGDDVVKDGVNLSGIYVRRRVREDGQAYHTIEFDIEDLHQWIPVLAIDTQRARRFWNVKIGQHNYHR